MGNHASSNTSSPKSHDSTQQRRRQSSKLQNSPVDDTIDRTALGNQSMSQNIDQSMNQSNLLDLTKQADLGSGHVQTIMDQISILYKILIAKQQFHHSQEADIAMKRLILNLPTAFCFSQDELQEYFEEIDLKDRQLYKPSASEKEKQEFILLQQLLSNSLEEKRQQWIRENFDDKNFPREQLIKELEKEYQIDFQADEDELVKQDGHIELTFKHKFFYILQELSLQQQTYNLTLLGYIHYDNFTIMFEKKSEESSLMDTWRRYSYELFLAVFSQRLFHPHENNLILAEYLASDECDFSYLITMLVSNTFREDCLPKKGFFGGLNKSKGENVANLSLVLLNFLLGEFAFFENRLYSEYYDEEEETNQIEKAKFQRMALIVEEDDDQELEVIETIVEDDVDFSKLAKGGITALNKNKDDSEDEEKVLQDDLELENYYEILGKEIKNKIKDTLLEDRLIKNSQKVLKQLHQSIMIYFEGVSSWETFFATNSQKLSELILLFNNLITYYTHFLKSLANNQNMLQDLLQVLYKTLYYCFLYGKRHQIGNIIIDTLLKLSQYPQVSQKLNQKMRTPTDIEGIPLFHGSINDEGFVILLSILLQSIDQKSVFYTSGILAVLRNHSFNLQNSNDKVIELFLQLLFALSNPRTLAVRKEYAHVLSQLLLVLETILSCNFLQNQRFVDKVIDNKDLFRVLMALEVKPGHIFEFNVLVERHKYNYHDQSKEIDLPFAQLKVFYLYYKNTLQEALRMPALKVLHRFLEVNKKRFDIEDDLQVCPQLNWTVDPFVEYKINKRVTRVALDEEPADNYLKKALLTWNYCIADSIVSFKMGSQCFKLFSLKQDFNLY